MQLENIIKRVSDLMQTDDANTDKQSAIVIRKYKNASESERDLLDGVFIALCGYSLDTIIAEYEDEEQEHKQTLEQYNTYFDDCERANKKPFSFDEWQTKHLTSML